MAEMLEDSTAVLWCRLWMDVIEAEAETEVEFGR